MADTFGTSKDLIGPKAWAYGLTPDNKLLNMPTRAILRIWRRMNYKHLTAHDSKDRIPYSCDRVIKDIANRFMENILAYQYYRRKYYYDKRNTYIKVNRSYEEVEMFSPLGNLSFETGVLRINKKTRKLLRKQGVWTDFNKPKPKPK